MIKLIACDLDNTLLDAAHELCAEDAAIINAIQDAGIEFMVATGRSYEGAKELIEPSGIRCDYVVLNGAQIRKQCGAILEQTPLGNDILRPLITMLREEDMCFHMYTDVGTVTFDAQRGQNEGLKHLMKNGFTRDEAMTIMTKGKFGSYDKEYENEEAFYEDAQNVYKLEMFLEDMQKQDSIRKKLAEISGIEVTNSVVDNIEVTSYEAQKGKALLAYCAHHGIQKEEVLVFGDSLNDLNMIEEFPNSFAVENAVDTILKKANYVTKSNLQHGVAIVLNEVLRGAGDDAFLKDFKNCQK